MNLHRQLGFALLLGLCAMSLMTQVQAQQPVIELLINGTSDSQADDDFITWAPTFCKARVQSGVPAGDTIEISLSNAISNTSGRVLFAPAQDPWPANTTATQATLTLTLSGNGDPVAFVIAGDFGHASVQRDDTVIVAESPSGRIVGQESLMVRVRKDARTLTTGERDRLLEAFRQLHLVQGRYAQYVMIHEVGLGEAHGGSGFLPWHRAFVLHLERALQSTDASVALPYWKYDEPTSDTKPPENLQFYDDDYIGGEPDSLGMASFSGTNPLRTWAIDGLSGVYRATANQNHTELPMIPGQTAIRLDNSSLSPSGYGLFVNGDGTITNPGLEGDPHGYAHIWAGLWSPGMEIRGWIANVSISPRDPLFFLLHCNVDRQWAHWQYRHNRFGVALDDYAPTGSYAGPGADRISHYLDETMWPWNELAGDPGTPADPNDDRPDASVGGSFPPATPFQLGPPSQPKPRDMIDYLGRHDPHTGHGFCYDDTPFHPAGVPFDRGPVPDSSSIATFLDGARPLNDRILAANNVRGLTKQQHTESLKLAADKEQHGQLRVKAFQVAQAGVGADELDDLISLSQDRTAPPELRRSVAERLHVLSNFSAVGHQQQGKILDALRQMLDDSDQEVRNSVINTLVGFSDKVAIQRLVDGLRDPNKELQPAHIALRNLANAQHADFYDVFAQYFNDRLNLPNRLAAAPGLARIPDGHEALRNAVMDPQEPSELRLLALKSLHANDRNSFPDFAIRIVEDTDAPEAMRTYAVAAITDQVESAKYSRAPTAYDVNAITQTMRTLATEADSPSLRRQSWLFLKNCDNNYLDYAPELIERESNESLKNELQKGLIDQQRKLLNRSKENR